LGLGGRGFLMNNEAYASQYIDHHIAADPRLGPVVMSRQNQAQNGKYPWLALGCLAGTAALATDALQLFGPASRATQTIASAPGQAALTAPVRDSLRNAAPVVAERLSDAGLARRYPERNHEERRDGALLSVFTPDGRHNRHVVLCAKERIVPRRHGTLLRSGA